MMRIMCPISVGELLDKITILMIKQENISDASKLANIEKELDALREIMNASLPDHERASELIGELRAVNERLWHVEDELRAMEARAEFGESFVALARSVYANNDERFRIKKQANTEFGSEIAEEKSFDSL